VLRPRLEFGSWILFWETCLCRYKCRDVEDTLYTTTEIVTLFIIRKQICVWVVINSTVHAFKGFSMLPMFIRRIFEWTEKRHHAHLWMKWLHKIMKLHFWFDCDIRCFVMTLRLDVYTMSKFMKYQHLMQKDNNQNNDKMKNLRYILTDFRG